MATLNFTSISPTKMRGVHGVGRRTIYGWLLIAVGILPMLTLSVAPSATVPVFAWFLILGGGIEIAHAIQRLGKDYFAAMLTSGSVTLALGSTIWIASRPEVTMLTLLVGNFLIVDCGARARLALRLRSPGGWRSVLVDEVLSIALAALIVSITLALLIVLRGPPTSLPLIGLFSAIWLRSKGVGLLMGPWPRLAKRKE